MVSRNSDSSADTFCNADAQRVAGKQSRHGLLVKLDITRRFERRIPGSNPGRATWMQLNSERGEVWSSRPAWGREIARQAACGGSDPVVPTEVEHIRVWGNLGTRVVWDHEIVGSNPITRTSSRKTQPGRSTVKDAVLIRRRRRFDSFSGYLQNDIHRSLTCQRYIV